MAARACRQTHYEMHAQHRLFRGDATRLYIREKTHIASASRTLHATFFDRDILTTRRTPTPSLASMSIKASVLNKSIRPRRTSLTRGCVTRSIFAASACSSRLDAIALCN